MVICGSSKKRKQTMRGEIEGYVIYMLDDTKREGVKGITSDTVFITDKAYIDLDVDTLIRDQIKIIPRYNKYGYIEKFDRS